MVEDTVSKRKHEDKEKGTVLTGPVTTTRLIVLLEMYS